MKQGFATKVNNDLRIIFDPTKAIKGYLAFQVSHIN